MYDEYIVNSKIYRHKLQSAIVVISMICQSAA